MKKFLKIFGALAGIIILSGGLLAFAIFDGASNLLDEIHRPVDRESIRDRDLNLGRDPISILVLGVDREGATTGGRSDTMMVVTVNPSDNSTKILSLARDTRVTLAGRGTVERLNHAYAWGGPQMAIETVQNFLNIPIDFYVSLDMEGFGPMIDAVNGVTVNNDLAFSQDGFHFPLGKQHLSGSEALAFVRMRKQDPQGDFGRQRRQRMVIEALGQEMVASGLTRFQHIFDAAEGHLETDFTMGILSRLLLSYGGAARNIQQLELRGNSSIIGGSYFQVVPDNQLWEMQTLLRRHLELE